MKLVTSLIIGLLILSGASAQAASFTCNSTSDSVAEGNACGQLGETRMLGDGSSIVACVASDTSQTGKERDCNWSGMTLGGGQAGDWCGHNIISVKGVRQSYRFAGDSYTYCAYGNSGYSTLMNKECHGSYVFAAIQTVRAANTAARPSDYPYFVGQDKYAHGDGFYKIFAKSGCPSGYSLYTWKNYGAETTCATSIYHTVCMKN